MRTIKFRGKRLDNGEWVYGDLFRMFGYPYIYPNYVPNGLNHYEVDPDTVGQFTGFHDTDGKEIYEGDIVKTILHDSRRQMFFKVIYSMDYCGFELQEYGRYSGGYLWNFDDFDEGSLIIIGNIHDNPELLTLNK